MQITEFTSEQSSNIQRVAYNDETKIMCIQFVHGGVYEYRGVLPHEHTEFIKSESPGRHFHAFIKNKYPGVQVAATPDFKEFIPLAPVLKMFKTFLQPEPGTSICKVEVPEGANFMSVAVEGDAIVAFFVVEENQAPFERTFLLMQTGESIPGVGKVKLNFCGTVVNGTTMHVFEMADQ